ncbi:uncharacterized protein BDW47DRAFT_131983 [Aspergillus candidus]|uniref:Uncharacterized protein n=1 Tax=Aspergillus candidus TaxID=41067 RepID=A0A2I2FA64_ASPCN|nr:hypothetical protein BDW47DRAFT_131983 [Aspergillus candidus]PLB37516.1 hypothetical protein BDW47DRAFT_131983 [Aspergillus candidus]
MPLQFPQAHGDWKFDLVGLLAIIGESIVSEVVQPLTASRTIFLPRLLPAPHALIRPSRRTALPSRPVLGIGVYSKQEITSLPYFPDMIHQLDLLRPYEVQEYHISLAAKATGDRHQKIATVKFFSPLKLLTVFSFLWTVGILVWAILLGDGPAVVAIVLVSAASSLHSAASFWKTSITRLSRLGAHKQGDIVLRTREGAFVVVHCTEEVARLLYTAPLGCDYVAGGTTFQILISVGTLLLMVGIVVMSNCSWTMQVVLGASYLALNALYMVCALTPAVSQYWHWDLSLFEIVMQRKFRDSYTEALWEAIRATRETDWVVRGRHLPNTSSWNKWLDEAMENYDNDDWEAMKARDQYFGEESREAGEIVPTSDDYGSWPTVDGLRRRPTIL